MHLRTFIASFGSVLLVLALAAPVPLTAPRVTSNVAPSLGSSPQCFSLAYVREIGPEWFPRRVRLTTDSSSLRADRVRWYRVITDSVRNSGYRDAWWRPVGFDSIEIAWHHSPAIRLPTRGDTLIGVALPTGVWSLFELALFAQPYAVRAVRSQCDKPVWRVPAAADSLYALLDAVMPELVRVVEEAWGTPAAWGRPASERTTVRLVSQLIDLPDSPLVGKSGNTRAEPRQLDSLWLHSWLQRGAIQAVCTDSTPQRCQREQNTMVVLIGKPAWYSPDSASVTVEMHRVGFGAGFGVLLVKHGDQWTVRSRRMRWIT